MSRITVLGAGAWGTALAAVLGENGHEVALWSRCAEHAAAMAHDGENRRHLPGCRLPRGVQPGSELEAAISDADWILIAVPSSAFRSIVEAIAPHRPGRVAWATKGLAAGSGGFLHGVVAEVLSPVPSMAVISGPSFAAEVGRGLPTAITVASTDTAFADDIVHAFHNERFRPYTSPDLLGVELGGAVKNVLAIATGISDGLGLGANARAALVTRGLAEIARLGSALGADARTLTGLAGMGDLLLTCTDDQSRNRRFGYALGQGQDPDSARAAVGSTVEGERTAAELQQLAAAHGIEMPICRAVHDVLSGRIALESAVRELMERSPKAELDGIG